jgi:hypothetical protein
VTPRFASAVLTLCAVAAAFSLPAWAALRRAGAWRWWDWAGPAYPAALWLALYLGGVGAGGPLNPVELVPAVMATVLLAYFRAFGPPRRWAAPVQSLLVHGCAALLVLVLRVLMPPLPS